MKYFALMVLLLPLSVFAQGADAPLTEAEKTGAADPHYKLAPSDADQQQMQNRLRPGNEVNMDDFLKDPAAYHWIGFYEAAAQLFEKGRKDEAVMWFYAGQIRGRVGAGLDPDPSRNGALLSSLNYGLGQPINEYAGSNLANWIKQVDAAIAWDEAHPLKADPMEVIGIREVDFDSENFRAVYAQVRNGLKQMRAQLAATDPAEWKRKRQENGLKD